MSDADELALAEAELELAQAKAAQAKAGAPQQEMTVGDVAGDLGKAALKGLGTAAEFVGDIGDYALVHPLSRMMPDYLPSTQFDPEIAQQGREQIKEATAPMLERSTQQGQNPYVDAALTGTEFGASAAVPFGNMGKASVLTNTLKEMGIFGGGAAGGSLLTEDNDLGALAGGLTASTRGLWVPQMLKKAGTGLANIFGKGAAPVQQSESIILQYADDAPTAMRRLNEATARGEKGTLGQLSGDRGILALEKAQAAQSKPLATTMDDINTQIADDAMNVLDDIPAAGSDSQALKEAGTERVQGVLKQARAQAEKQVARNAAATSDEVQRIKEATGVEALETGQRLSKSIDKMRAGAKAEQTAYNVERLNEAAPAGVTVTETGPAGVMQLKSGYDAGYDAAWGAFKQVPKRTMTELNKILLKADEVNAPKIQRFIEEIDDLGQYPSPEQARAVDQRIRNAIESAASGKIETDLMQLLKETRKALRNTLPKAAREQMQALDSGYAQYLTVRNAASKADPDGLMEAEQVWQSGKKIGGEFEAATQTGPLMQSTKPYLGRAEELGGRIQQSEKATDEIVRGIKESGAEKIAAETKQSSVLQKSIQKTADARAKKAGQTLTAELMETEQPVRVIEKALTGKMPMAKMRELAKTARSGGPRAVEGLRRGVVDYFTKGISKENGMLKPNAAKQFDEIADSLTDVFSPQEIERMRKASQEANKIYASAGVRPADIPEAAEGIPFLMATVLGVNVGSKVASNPLMGAAFGKRFVTKYGKTIPNKRIKDTLNDMLVNPQKYAKELEELANFQAPDEIAKVLQKIFSTAPQTQAATE